MKRFTTLLVFLLAIGIFAPMPLGANEISVTIDGEQMDFDGMQMVIVDYRALLPVRDIFEHLGFDVDWEHETRTVHLSRYPEFAISITIGDYVFVNNGVEYPLDVPAQIIDGRTLLPIRAVLESTGYYVVWDVDAYAVFITSATPEYIIIFGREYSTSLTSLNLMRVSGMVLIAPEEVAQLRYMTNLTYLNLRGNNIYDILPLAGLTNLVELNMWGNRIGDNLEPLAGLTNLRDLDVGNNRITDILPLANLTNLTNLSVISNSISDIIPVAGLTNLTRLSLVSNEISDITPVAGLTNLTSLAIWSNEISDLTPLSGLTGLTFLDAGWNQISDLSPLAGLASLETLWLHGNHISDLSPLEGLTNLVTLSLWNNQVSNISPLAYLDSLEWLSLEGNDIDDLSPLDGLRNLENVYIDQ